MSSRSVWRREQRGRRSGRRLIWLPAVRWSRRMVMNYGTLLGPMARINPTIWDAIYPHGPTSHSTCP